MQYRIQLGEHHESQLDALKGLLSRSLKLTGPTIIASLVLLPLTNAGTPFGWPYLAWTCLAATVAAAVRSLLTFRPLIGEMLPELSGRHVNS